MQKEIIDKYKQHVENLCDEDTEYWAVDFWYSLFSIEK